MAASKQVWSNPHPVEPTAGRWRMEDVPNPHDAYLPPPPANDSERTRRELEELHVLTANRTPADVDLIRYWAIQEFSPMTHWAALADEMARRYQLSPPAAARIHCLMNEAIFGSLIACWRFKYHFLRPRPTDLDPSIDTSVIPVPAHPSYPSGHSTVAGAAATVLSRFFPDDQDRFWEQAEASGFSRLLSGIHYRSDHEAGILLGSAIGQQAVLEANKDRAPKAYHLPPVQTP